MTLGPYDYGDDISSVVGRQGKGYTVKFHTSYDRMTLQVIGPIICSVVRLTSVK